MGSRARRFRSPSEIQSPADRDTEGFWRGKKKIKIRSSTEPGGHMGLAAGTTAASRPQKSTPNACVYPLVEEHGASME